MTPTRVVVVLGYSDGRSGDLHPVCAARLERAAEVATADDVVVLSGWARSPGSSSEAELMRAAWRGSAREVVVDPDARTTVENMANALNDVLRVGAREVVVVTSSWHAARARAALRWLLLHTGVRVGSASPPGRSRRSSLRELALWPLLPFQLWRVSRGRLADLRLGLRHLDVDALLRLAQRAARTLGAHGEDLREDRERRLRLRVGADVEAARALDPGELLLADARLEQPLAAALLVAPRAERADVERLGRRARR